MLAGAVHAVEAVEQTRQVGLGDRGAAVADRQAHGLVLRLDGHPHGAAVDAVADGVVEQVGHRPAQQRGVGGHDGVAAHLQPDLGVLEQDVQEVGGLVGQCGQRQRGQVGRQRPLVGAGHEQHVVDDRAQPLQLLQVGLQRVLQLVDVARAGQGDLGLADQVAQRRAQLVGDVGVEGRQALIGRLQAIQRAVEGAHQPDQLGRQVLGRHAQAGVGRVQGAGALRQAVDRRQAPAGDPPAQQADQRRDQHRHAQRPDAQHQARGVERGGVGGDHQAHVGTAAEGGDLAGQGHEPLAVGMDDAKAVAGRLKRLAGHELEARIGALDAVADGPVGRGERLQLVGHQRPARGILQLADHRHDDLRAGVQLLGLVALQFQALEAEQGHAGQDRHRAGGDGEHQGQAPGDRLRREEWGGGDHDEEPSGRCSRT